MAIVILGRDSAADGTWQVDYDTVALTVGHTVTKGTASGLLLTVTEIDTTTGQPTGVSFHKDLTADFGKGRVVDFSNVPNSRVPVHVKGEFYPYDFDATWFH